MNGVIYKNIEEAKKKGVKEIIVEHKKEIGAGIGVVLLLALTALGIRNYDKIDLEKLEKIFDKRKVAINDNCSDTFLKTPGHIQKENNYSDKTIYVPEHFRNLPTGHKVSKSKIAEAAKREIKIPVNMTFVDGYKYKKSA